MSKLLNGEKQMRSGAMQRGQGSKARQIWMSHLERADSHDNSSVDIPAGARRSLDIDFV